MIELRPAPKKVRSAIRRRLRETTPAARLINDSVKHVPVPDTRFDASFFIFELHGIFHFVTEVNVAPFPHIFHSFQAKNDDPRENMENLLVSLLKLKERIQSDPAFGSDGSSIIELNGAAKRLNGVLKR